MARVRHSTEYYDYIDTCYECKRCGAQKRVNRVYTVVGWTSRTSAGYDSDGRYHSAESSSRDKKIYIAEDGYYHREFDNKRGWCKKCIAKRRKKIFFVTLIVVAAILTLSLSDTVLGFFLNRGSGVYEWTYNLLLDKYENHDEYQANIETDAPAKAMIDDVTKKLSENDFYLRFYDTGSGEVQKYTDRNIVTYFYRFKDGCGELSNTTYIHMEDILYVNGDEKIAYRSTSAEYAALLEKLQAYLPQNYCMQGVYTSEGRLASASDDLYATIARGEDCTVLYDSGDGYYFEKTSESFARLHIGKDSRKDKLPKLSDYTVVE